MKALVNFAKGGWYPRGRLRLLQSLRDINFDGDVMSWTDEKEFDSPPHERVPYGFKIAAFRRAQEAGHEIVLWCDAAIWAIKPLDPIFRYIAEKGYVMFHSGHLTGVWTSDACLSAFGTDRETAMHIPMISAGCLGLDFRHARSREFLDRLEAASKDGRSFQGNWTNSNCEVSNDPRVRGHRHDQSVSSLLAHEY